MANLEFCQKSFGEVGREEGLVFRRLHLYVCYMMERWAHKEFQMDDGYKATWANRFFEGSEWHQSDEEGQQLLVRIEHLYDDQLVDMIDKRRDENASSLSDSTTGNSLG